MKGLCERGLVARYIKCAATNSSGCSKNEEVMYLWKWERHSVVDNEDAWCYVILK